MAVAMEVFLPLFLNDHEGDVSRTVTIKITLFNFLHFHKNQLTVKATKMERKEGQFVLLPSRAYHVVFSTGYKKKANFAYYSWLSFALVIGKTEKWTTCYTGVFRQLNTSFKKNQPH